MAEYAQCQQEQEQERDDNGMWECEYQEWIASHEQETEARVSVPTACPSATGLEKPF
jgi:uncharacterized Fe-S cluster protein YjdI